MASIRKDHSKCTLSDTDDDADSTSSRHPILPTKQARSDVLFNLEASSTNPSSLFPPPNPSGGLGYNALSRPQRTTRRQPERFYDLDYDGTRPISQGVLNTVQATLGLESIGLERKSAEL
jgi:hypothetical protein